MALAPELLAGLCAVQVLHVLYHGKVLSQDLSRIHADVGDIAGLRGLPHDLALQEAFRQREIPAVFPERMPGLACLFIPAYCFPVLLFKECRGL